MSLNTFLTRLIWLCVLPLMLAASWLAFESVRSAQAERDIVAANRAQNLAIAIDQHLQARIAALEMLAASPLADDASRRPDFYREAQGFRESFGAHVILADPEMNMLFNTRAPLASALSKLPRPQGRAAAPTALETGAPAVGDVFFGRLAGEALVAIAVPGKREGKTAFLLLAIFETRHFQQRLDQVALPAGWSLALQDGTGAAIARRMPPGLNTATDIDAAGRVVVKLALAPWSVVLEIPRNVYRAPLLSTAAALALLILGATLAGVLGGRLAGRRLGKAAASLVATPAPGAPPPAIVEFATVRGLLDAAAEQRASADAALREREETLRLVTETIDEVFWMTDVATETQLYISPSYERVWGRTRTSLRENPRSFLDAVHPDDLDRLLAALAAKPAGQFFECEYRVIRPDATVRCIWDRGYPIRDASDKVTGYAGVAHDITERKQAEAALGESRARLEALTRRLLEVQETERRAIARELHDEVGGALTAVKLNLQALRRTHTAEQREAALADGLALVDGAIKSVRSLSLDLRPAVLDDLGLIPALKWYCERQAQRAGMKIELALDAIDLRSVPQLESACFRIAQEAVTNALRHSGARHIEVTLHREGDRFVIEIADDGGGFDPAAARKRGLAGEAGGLLGMGERATLLCGRFDIDSAPGVGTRVRAEFAMPEDGLV